jgi:hypothetical protein
MHSVPRKLIYLAKSNPENHPKIKSAVSCGLLLTSLNPEAGAHAKSKTPAGRSLGNPWERQSPDWRSCNSQRRAAKMRQTFRERTAGTFWDDFAFHH